jgi:hypothetical protein
MFGTENPGAGASFDPKTERQMDDIAPYIKSMDWLSEADKKLVFEDNAKAFFKLKV